MTRKRGGRESSQQHSLLDFLASPQTIYLIVQYPTIWHSHTGRKKITYRIETSLDQTLLQKPRQVKKKKKEKEKWRHGQSKGKSTVSQRAILRPPLSYSFSLFFYLFFIPTNLFLPLFRFLFFFFLNENRVKVVRCPLRLFLSFFNQTRMTRGTRQSISTMGQHDSTPSRWNVLTPHQHSR